MPPPKWEPRPGLSPLAYNACMSDETKKERQENRDKTLLDNVNPQQRETDDLRCRRSSLKEAVLNTYEDHGRDCDFLHLAKTWSLMMRLNEFADVEDDEGYPAVGLLVAVAVVVGDDIVRVSAAVVGWPPPRTPLEMHIEGDAEARYCWRLYLCSWRLPW